MEEYMEEYFDPIKQRQHLILEKIGDMLQLEGIPSAMNLAEQYDDNNLGAAHYMRNAAARMIEEPDIDRAQSGLGYFALLSDISPMLEEAQIIAEIAEKIARNPGSEEFTRQCLLVSFNYLRTLSQVDEFKPDAAYVSTLSLITSIAEGRGQDELVRMAVVEHNVHALAAIREYQRTHQGQETGDMVWLLQTIATELYDTEPAVAERAVRMISLEDDRYGALQSIASIEIVKAFEANDFETAKNKCRDYPSLSLTNLWVEVINKVQMQPEQAKIWYDNVESALTGAWPDYFTSMDNVDETERHYFGLALGMLGKTDTLTTVVRATAKGSSCNLMAIFASFGYGMAANKAGFDEFYAQTNALDADIRETMAESYDTGQTTAMDAAFRSPLQ